MLDYWESETVQRQADGGAGAADRRSAWCRRTGHRTRWVVPWTEHPSGIECRQPVPLLLFAGSRGSFRLDRLRWAGDGWRLVLLSESTKRGRFLGIERQSHHFEGVFLRACGVGTVPNVVNQIGVVG